MNNFNWTLIGILILLLVIAYLIGRLHNRKSADIPTDLIDLYCLWSGLLQRLYLGHFFSQLLKPPMFSWFGCSRFYFLSLFPYSVGIMFAQLSVISPSKFAIAEQRLVIIWALPYLWELRRYFRCWSTTIFQSWAEPLFYLLFFRE